jgi:NADH dehydrogenase FAD-containing subunit
MSFSLSPIKVSHKFQVLYPIKENFFAKYSSDQYEFIHATVTALDTTTKTVTLHNNQTITYDYLVIASGSHTVAVNSGIPVKSPATDTIRTSIESAQARIAKASTIVIAGGGAVALEIAGEIAEGYPNKKLTLICSSKRLLPMLGEKVADIALTRLKKLGVEVLLGVKVLTNKGIQKEGIVKLENGKTVQADLYIPAIGVVPNNSFIPPQLLNDSGYLMTTPEQKISNSEVLDVYGVGDITSSQSKMAVAVTQQIAITVANLKNDIEKTGTRKSFQKENLTMVIPIGGKGGVAEMGDLGGLILWSWIVRLIKGNYFLGMPFAISGLKKQ